MTTLLETLVTHYNLHPPIHSFPIACGSNNKIIGIHTGLGDFAFKTIVAPHDPTALAHEQTLLSWLKQQNLSFDIPASVSTKYGFALLQLNTVYHILMPLLPGQKPDWQDAAQIELVGAALGELHMVLERYPHATNAASPPYGALNLLHPQIANPYGLKVEQLNISSTAETKAQMAWWRAELAALHTFINGPYRALPWQLIHSDFGHSNTLYSGDNQGGHITAVLDFEFIGPDARAMDLAAGLYYCMRIWENPAPLVNAVAFTRGYAQKQRLTAPEIAAIPWLMRLRNAASAIWWFGRQMANGQTVDLDARITAMRHFVNWLYGAEGKCFQQILVTHSECSRS